MKPQPILIRGGWVVTLDPSLGEMRGADVLIEGSRIVAVDRNIECPEAEIIDARGMIVSPGFVDTHRHTWQSCVRHSYADVEARRYFAEMLGFRGARYRPEDVRIGTLLGAIGALEAGTTTLLDWAHIQNTPEHGDAAIAALKDSGIRAVFAHGWPLIDGDSWIVDSQLGHPTDIRRLRTEYFSSEDQLLTLALAGRGPEMTRREVWMDDLRLARELAIRSTIHVGAYAHNARHRAVAQMHQAGVLGPDITFIHCCRSGDDEIAMIADAGVTVSLGVHCEMNAQGIGDIPLDRLLAAGIRPSLSGDTETKCSGDMFTQMRSLLGYYRSWIGGGHSRTPNAPSTLSTRDILEFATVRGAQAAGLDRKVGVLAPGKEADLILVRTSDLNLTPVSDPVAALVLGAHAGNVDSVFVAGRAVKRHGSLLRGDLQRIRDAADASLAYVLGDHD